MWIHSLPFTIIGSRPQVTNQNQLFIIFSFFIQIKIKQHHIWNQNASSTKSNLSNRVSLSLSLSPLWPDCFSPLSLSLSRNIRKYIYINKCMCPASIGRGKNTVFFDYSRKVKTFTKQSNKYPVQNNNNNNNQIGQYPLALSFWNSKALILNQIHSEGWWVCFVF